MLIYLILYISAYLFTRIGIYPMAGISLIISAIYLYSIDVRKSDSFINLRGLFTLGFVGGEGIACLKLSYLGRSWSIITWASFFISYISFWLIYEIYMRHIKDKEEKIKDNKDNNKYHEYKSLYSCIIILTIVTTASFIIEAMILGFIPLFVRGIPHAYSYFHIKGLHYITVSCVLEPALAIIYYHNSSHARRYRDIIVAIATLISLMIPILCVSRFQLIYAMLLALIIYSMIYKKSYKIWIISFIILIPLYLILTISRSHSISYLSDIFEMRYNIPIYISQPYTYISNNYDNFDCLVSELTRYTYGKRMLIPLWTLTGLKYIFPDLIVDTLYITKTELTTLTIIYDAYYDFGIIGVAAFSALIGYISSMLDRAIRYIRDDIDRPSHIVICLIYAQFAFYMATAFFTTWLSNPTTWFYLIVTLAIGLYMRIRSNI